MEIGASSDCLLLAKIRVLLIGYGMWVVLPGCFRMIVTRIKENYEPNCMLGTCTCFLAYERSKFVGLELALPGAGQLVTTWPTELMNYDYFVREIIPKFQDLLRFGMTAIGPDECCFGVER